MTSPPRLVAIAGAQNGSEWVLRPGTTVLGRDDDCTVTLADQGASRRHAELSWEDATLHLRDLGSTNHTRVNGAVIDSRALAAGDQVQIGDTVLRVEWAAREGAGATGPATSPAAAPAPAPTTAPPPATAPQPASAQNGGTATGGGRGRGLIAFLGIVVVAAGAFVIFGSRPAPPPSGRQLQNEQRQQRDAAEAQAEELAAARAAQGSRAPAAAAVELYEQARTLALYEQLEEARALLRRALQMSPDFDEARALMADCDARISRHVDQLLHRARTASATLHNDRATRLLEEAVALTGADDPRRAEAQELLRQIAAQNRQ